MRKSNSPVYGGADLKSADTLFFSLDLRHELCRAFCC